MCLAMMKKLLFVDDERQILNSLNRMMMDTDYDVITAEGAKEALEILDQEPDIDLIISDMQMPYMNGYEFLSIVKEKYPRIIRVILSGYTEEKLIYKSLQENIAKLYLLKPWKSDSMLREIEHIFETEAFINAPDVITAVNNAGVIHGIPAKAMRILNLIQMEASFDKISKEIAEDVALAANILRIANSAFFNAKTGSIKTALNFIGTQSLSTFIRMTALLQCVEPNGPSFPHKHIESLWQHAFLTSRLFQYLYSRVYKEELPVSAKAAGLLHNIGKAVMLKIYSQNYLPFLYEHVAQQERIDFATLLEKEQRTFQSTHQQIGAYLLDGWDFPFPIIEATLYHHDPCNQNIVNKKLVASVHIAQKCAYDLIAFEEIRTNSDSSDIPDFCHGAFEYTGMGKVDLLEKLKEFSS